MTGSKNFYLVIASFSCFEVANYMIIDSSILGSFSRSEEGSVILRYFRK
jgi:hypothetical protein